MRTTNVVIGLLNDLLCFLVRQTPQEHSNEGFLIQHFSLTVVMECRSISLDTYLFILGHLVVSRIG